jgi:hypothetical protein
MHLRLKWTALALSCVAAVLACTSADAQVRRGKGWVREPAHVVAALPLMQRFRNYLPEEIDLSSRFPTPGDQGQQSSCTAWATGYAVRSYYEAERRKWNFATPGQIISPAYIYNRLHDFSGDCDIGTPISSALGVLKADGALTLSTYPYVENDCARPVSPESVRTSAEFRISGWTGVDPKKLDDVKGQLAQGHPVIFGMEVSEDFENSVGNQIYDDTTSERTGGHAMVIVGYSERRQAFKVMNSWGTEWGDGGFGWISYRAIRQLSDVMFVMEVPPIVVAPPTPRPRPAVTPPAPPPAPVVVAPPEPEPRPQPVVTPPQPVPGPEPVVTPPAPKPSPAPVVVAPPEPKPRPQPVVTPPEPKPRPQPVVTPPEPVPSPEPVVTPPAPKPAPAPVVVAPPAPKPKPKPRPVVKPQPPKPVVMPAIAAVQAQVTARLREVRCARLESTLGADRVVRLQGFAGSADDLAKLEADLRDMPGVRRVDANVTLYPWPQCEVFLNFADALKAPRGLAASFAGAPTRVLTEGDSLTVQVRTPSFPSYLYVTYLQANGDAVHLAWPQGRFPKAMRPNTEVTFGGGAGGEPVYRITPPVGDEIVVVVASASPLFQDEPPETTIDRDYLTAFRKAFLVPPKGGGGSRIVSAIAVPLTTQAKP